MFVGLFFCFVALYPNRFWCRLRQPCLTHASSPPLYRIHFATFLIPFSRCPQPTLSPHPLQAFVEAGGVALLVDVVACCHQGSERTALTTPTGTNLLASSAAVTEAKEWFWYDRGAVSGKAEGQDDQLRREEQQDADQGAVL